MRLARRRHFQHDDRGAPRRHRFDRRRADPVGELLADPAVLFRRRCGKPRLRPRRCSGGWPGASAIPICSQSISIAIPWARTPGTSGRCSPKSAARATAAAEANAERRRHLWRLALSARQSRARRALSRPLSRGRARQGRRGAARQLADAQCVGQGSRRPLRSARDHPDDATASAPGVDLAIFRENAPPRSASASRRTRHPEIAHYVALLARATAAAGRFDDAYALYKKAAGRRRRARDGEPRPVLETGDHAPKDLKAAYALYEKAAERGIADGAINLAVALAEGEASTRTCRAPTRCCAGLASGIGAGDLRSGRIRRTRLWRQDGGRPRSLSARREFPATPRAITPRPCCRRGARRPQGLTPPPPRCCVRHRRLRRIYRRASRQDADLDAGHGQGDLIQVEIRQLLFGTDIDGRRTMLTPALKQWRLLGPPQKA